MRKIVLTFGLIAGAVMSLTMVVAILLKNEVYFESGLIVGYTSMVLAFLMVYFGVRTYRDQTPTGTIGFWKAFGVGMMIVLVGSACYVATWEVLYFNFVPDYMEKYAEHALAKARAAGATAAELEAQAAEFAKYGQWYRNPFLNVAMTLMEPLPVGVAMSLLSAALLRRRRPNGASASAAPAGATAARSMV